MVLKSLNAAGTCYINYIIKWKTQSFRVDKLEPINPLFSIVTRKSIVCIYLCKYSNCTFTYTFLCLLLTLFVAFAVACWILILQPVINIVESSPYYLAKKNDDSLNKHDWMFFKLLNGKAIRVLLQQGKTSPSKPLRRRGRLRHNNIINLRSFNISLEDNKRDMPSFRSKITQPMTDDDSTRLRSPSSSRKFRLKSLFRPKTSSKHSRNRIHKPIIFPRPNYIQRLPYRPDFSTGFSSVRQSNVNINPNVGEVWQNKMLSNPNSGESWQNKLKITPHYKQLLQNRKNISHGLGTMPQYNNHPSFIHGRRTRDFTPNEGLKPFTYFSADE